ncbi:hypothetical protein J3458_019598 [Metarhizium acridum]|uniref:uncharacterized protein n=1 Tax=Metarhizium acridum TaxID=92637 RepID=UPI001C6AC629|nr:hypothetical protein J3458_019598 [Metarhizium acridum]
MSADDVPTATAGALDWCKRQERPRDEKLEGWRVGGSMLRGRRAAQQCDAATHLELNPTPKSVTPVLGKKLKRSRLHDEGCSPCKCIPKTNQGNCHISMDKKETFGDDSAKNMAGHEFGCLLTLETLGRCLVRTFNSRSQSHAWQHVSSTDVDINGGGPRYNKAFQATSRQMEPGDFGGSMICLQPPKPPMPAPFPLCVHPSSVEYVSHVGQQPVAILERATSR